MNGSKGVCMWVVAVDVDVVKVGSGGVCVEVWMGGGGDSGNAGPPMSGKSSSMGGDMDVDGNGVDDASGANEMDDDDGECEVASETLVDGVNNEGVSEEQVDGVNNEGVCVREEVVEADGVAKVAGVPGVDEMADGEAKVDGVMGVDEMADGAAKVDDVAGVDEMAYGAAKVDEKADCVDGVDVRHGVKMDAVEGEGACCFLRFGSLWREVFEVAAPH